MSVSVSSVKKHDAFYNDITNIESSCTVYVLTICIHLVERFMVRQAGKILHKCGTVYALFIFETDFRLSDSLTIYKVKHYGKWAVIYETLTIRIY